MKLYVANCHDRHIDPVIRVFSDQNVAIGFARKFMAQNMAHPEHVKEFKVEGYLLNLVYGEDGDKANVQEVILDNASY